MSMVVVLTSIPTAVAMDMTIMTSTVVSLAMTAMRMSLGCWPWCAAGRSLLFSFLPMLLSFSGIHYPTDGEEDE